MKAYTDINILLDRSGSMDTIKAPMKEAFAKFVTEHRKNPSTRLTLVQFDTQNDQEVVYENIPVKNVDGLHLNPLGGTPLFDALCKFIDRTGERYAKMRESERPDQVLFVVITDGEENSSRQYTRADVRSRIERQIGTYSWNFIYLGANQDAYKEALSYGMPIGGVINYTASVGGTAGAFAGLVSNTAAYASQTGNMRGKTRSLTFTKEQQDAAIDNQVSTTTTGNS